MCNPCEIGVAVLILAANEIYELVVMNVGTRYESMWGTGWFLATLRRSDTRCFEFCEIICTVFKNKLTILIIIHDTVEKYFNYLYIWKIKQKGKGLRRARKYVV